MHAISIIDNQNGHFAAEQRSQDSSFLLIIPAILFLGLTIYIVRLRAWKMLALPALALFIFVPLLPSRHPFIYGVRIDEERRKITSEIKRDGRIVSSTTVSAGDVASADMQFNRGARTIVLIGRDGSQHFPLGEAQLQNEPDQYVILNALRDVIGQVPTAPQ